MEDVLSTYALAYDPTVPVICMDEASKQLIGEVATPLPMRPGQPQCVDYEYERLGVCSEFIFCEPLAGWRHVTVTERRTKKDWAACIRELVDVHYPHARKIRLVMDNLNTHTGASVYEAFAPQEARRILEKLEFHYTPKHASWLNMAEIEIGIMNRQCLDRRIDTIAEMRHETAAWEKTRNRKKAKIHWTFTIAAARRKLKKLYPSIEG
jgi:DDE superfamily endonuclease